MKFNKLLIIPLILRYPTEQASSKKQKPNPDTENIMRQIFGNTPVTSSVVPKVSKSKKLEQIKPTTVNKQVVPQQQFPPLPPPAQEDPQVDFDNLDDFDYNNFELDGDEDNFDENDSSQSNGKKRRVLTKNQRLAANVRERKRMNIMNDAFVNLKAVLPQKTGRKRRKMSRLDIVIGALEYISYLDELLQTDGPIENNFEAYQRSLDFY